jgi:hypothetical protein
LCRLRSLSANEKFSGKGHRQHICKDCKREGRTGQITNQSDPIVKRGSKFNRKMVKIKLIVQTDLASYLFFEYKGEKYGMNTDFDDNSIIFKYQKNGDYPFVVADDSIHNHYDLLEVIWDKYYDYMENRNYYDYYQLLEMEEWNIQPKEMEYLKLVEDIQSIDQQYRIFMMV